MNTLRQKIQDYFDGLADLNKTVHDVANILNGGKRNDRRNRRIYCLPVPDRYLPADCFGFSRCEGGKGLSQRQGK